MKTKINLSVMTTEDIQKLVLDLLKENRELLNKIELLEQELARLKKSRLGQK